MADDVIFEKEDRVKIISGKLKGNKGYVRYVGTVGSKEDAIYVGVELDAPNGKHDGKVKGKRFFKCRDRHGYMAPFEVFALFGKSKKKILNRKHKLKSTKPSRSSTPSSRPNSRASTPSLSKKDAITKPKRRLLDRDKKNGKPSTKKKKSAKLHKNISVTPITDEPYQPLSVFAEPPSPSPTPIVTQITYADASVQTDLILSVVNDDNDIASVSKEVAEAHASMIRSLREQINKLNSEIICLKATNLKLENELLSKNDLIELITIEKEGMNEEIENYKIIEREQVIMIENLELDIEDLHGEKEHIRENMLVDLSIGEQNINDILLQNSELKSTMDTLNKTVMKEIGEKNTEIMSLSLKCKSIASLNAHILELERQLLFKQNLENELLEFKREIDLRSDSDKMIEILSTKNVELEYEIKRLNEVNKHFINVQDVFAEMERENEQYIFDLNDEMKNREMECSEYERKYEKANKELRHSQKTVFEFKEYIRKLEDTKRRMNVSFSKKSETSKDLKLEKEMLVRCNVELLDRINNIKKELIHYTNIAAKGFSDSIYCEILKQHIPGQIKCDYGCMELLGFLQRISFKAQFAKKILDSFYISFERQENTMLGVQMFGDNIDIRDTYKVLEICPMLVKHDRFIDCVFRGLITAYNMEKFNDSINDSARLLDIEEKYNKLLQSASSNNIRGGDTSVSISDIFSCNDLFRSFICKHFPHLNPEQKYRPKEKIDKWAVYQVVQELKYNLYNMQLKTNQMNDMIIAENEDGDDDDDHGDDGERGGKRMCMVGVLQKMEEYQAYLTQIIRRALQHCEPVRCMNFGKRHNVNMNKLNDDNYIGIEYDFIERTAQMMRSLTTKQNLLLESLTSVFEETDLSHFDRIGKVNRLLDEESELSSCGIVVGLEQLYKHLKPLPYELEQLSSVANINNDDNINHNGNNNEHNISTPWIEKAKIIRRELAEADIIRDALESAQAQIKYKHKELLLEKSATQEIKSRLDVVKLELAKQHTINRDLVRFELSAKESKGKILSYIDKNKQLKQANNNLLKTTNELESQLSSYQNTLKSMKLKSSKRTIRHLHDDDDSHSHTHRHSRSPHKLQRHSSLHNVVGIKTLNGLTSFGEPSNSWDNMADCHATDDRMIISQLHKELDLNKQYNKLLEKTVNSLRHSHNIYDLNRQWIELKRDLKPLPNFNSINKQQYKQYLNRVQILKNRQKNKRLQEDKERNKLLCISGKSNVETDNKEIDDMDDSDILSSFKQKEIKKKRYFCVQKSLAGLDQQFGEIYSCPNIVDLCNKKKQNNITYKQELIGRNIKLRNIKLQCCELAKQCKEIESNFDFNDETKDGNNDNLRVLGRIDIEGLTNNKYSINKTKVCLNRNNVLKLQNYLNVLC